MWPEFLPTDCAFHLTVAHDLRSIHTIGLSVIYKRRNSAHMDTFATDAALKTLDQLVPNGNGEGIMLTNQELIERLLNLMHFEMLHDWLAPTGMDIKPSRPHRRDALCRAVVLSLERQQERS